MHNLIPIYQNDSSVLEGIKKLNLITTHPKFKVGDTISFIGGYNKDILYKSIITGFDTDGDIYVLWDCYWFPIRDEEFREITVLN